MSNYRLTDILKSKTEGAEWYCLEAPEETRVWVSGSPWDNDIFKKAGISPVVIQVSSDMVVGDKKDVFSYKAPLVLSCGVDVPKGFIKTRTNKSASFTIRIDSCIELNQIMDELSKKTGLTSWDVKKLKVYNADDGVFVEFALHNPDGNGTGLFTYRFEIGKSSRLYPDVVIADQQRYVKKFYNNLAHCTAAKSDSLVHSCALKKKVKKKQIIRRSAKKRPEKLLN